MVGHVVGQYVAQQLPVVGPSLPHLGQLPFRLALPQEVQPGRDLHQPRVVGHQHQEDDEQQQHLRRQRHGPRVRVVLREHLRVGERRERRVHDHHDGGQERLDQEVQLERGGQRYQAQHPREHQVLRVHALARVLGPPSAAAAAVLPAAAAAVDVRVAAAAVFGRSVGLSDQVQVRREQLKPEMRTDRITVLIEDQSLRGR